MPAANSRTPVRTLVRNLVLLAVLAVGLYALFIYFNEHFFASKGLNAPEFLALEIGAVLLVAYLLARAITSATTIALERRGVASRGHAVRLFINLLVAIGAILVLFNLAGVSAESIFLGSAFAGIVVGLAAQTVLANVFAGLLIVLADPYRPGDRVSFITSNYGALAPSYPHEMVYPVYTGTVRDVGLMYTVIDLDGGGQAKFPNGIVLNALSLHEAPGGARAFRVRMTFPQNVPVSLVEEAVTNVPRAAVGTPPDLPAPHLEVADISEKTWDGVVTVWSTELREDAIRDQVLREVLARLPASQKAV